MYITRVISLAISRLENWQSLLDVEKREVEGGGRNYLVDCTEYGGLLGRKCALIRRRLLLSTFRKDGRLTGGRRLDASPPPLSRGKKFASRENCGGAPFSPFSFFRHSLKLFFIFSLNHIYIFIDPIIVGSNHLSLVNNEFLPLELCAADFQPRVLTGEGEGRGIVNDQDQVWLTRLSGLIREFSLFSSWSARGGRGGGGGGELDDRFVDREDIGRVNFF